MSTEAPPQMAKKQTQLRSVPQAVTSKVRIGDMVYWYPSPDSKDPCAAFVTRIGTEVLALSILRPGQHNLSLRDGVRYITDERYEISGNREAGVWDFKELASE